MSSKSQAQSTTTDELMGYVYKVSCYESKRHRISDTDVYYATPQDCQWALDSLDYKQGLIQIHLIQVKQSDMKYQSAHQNRKSQAEPEAAAAEPEEMISDVSFDSGAVDEALYKDNLDWQFQRPTNGTKYSAVYIYEPVVEEEPEDSSEDDELPEALQMIVEVEAEEDGFETVEEAEAEEDGFETVEEAEAEVEAPPPSTFECCVCMEEQVLSLQYPLPCSHGLCMVCYQEMSRNRCNMKCPCCRGPLEENPTPPTTLVGRVFNHVRHFVNNHLPIGRQRHPVNGNVMVEQRTQLMDRITHEQTNHWSTAVADSPLNLDSYVASRTRMTSMTNFINSIDTIDDLQVCADRYIEMCQDHYLECQARGVPFAIELDIGNTPGTEYNHEVSGNMWIDVPVARPARRARRCGFCHQTGHNRRTCSLRLNQ